MSRHCWVIEVPTTRGGWQVRFLCDSMARAKRHIKDYPWLHGRIVKYVPEVEDE